MKYILSVAMLTSLVVGCTQAPVPLEYPGARAAAAGAVPSRSVGVYLLQDVRPGFKANVAAREQRLVGAELPITFAADLESQTPVNDFVSSALTTEFSRHGLRVAVDARFSKAPDFEQALRRPETLIAPGVDYVVFGRINHESWYSAGFAGLLFQGSMPKGRAYCDLDLAAVSTRSGKVVWVGEASHKLESDETSAPAPGAIGGYLSRCLETALGRVMTQGSLLGSLRTEPTPP